MKALPLALALAMTTALPVQAGGPVLVEDATETTEPDARGGWLVPALIILGVAIIASSGDDDSPAPITPPGPICYSEGCF